MKEKKEKIYRGSVINADDCTQYDDVPEQRERKQNNLFVAGVDYDPNTNEVHPGTDKLFDLLNDSYHTHMRRIQRAKRLRERI